MRRFLRVKPQRLTRAALETLAIVAYRQPVTRPEVEEIRGVDCGAVMKALLERKLVKILGKKEEPGRPILYGTTREFLEFFALKDLASLPTLREFHELSEEHREIVEKEAPGRGRRASQGLVARARRSEGCSAALEEAGRERRRARGAGGGHGGGRSTQRRGAAKSDPAAEVGPALPRRTARPAPAGAPERRLTMTRTTAEVPGRRPGSPRAARPRSSSPPAASR